MLCGVMENQSTLSAMLPPYRLVKSIGPGATHLQMEIFMEYIKAQGALISVVSARFKIEQLGTVQKLRNTFRGEGEVNTRFHWIADNRGEAGGHRGPEKNSIIFEWTLILQNFYHLQLI